MLNGDRLTSSLARLLPEEGDFPSPTRSTALASKVGLWLGISFLLAFVTGVYSHVAQLADPLLPIPARPVWLYRLSQTLHVAAGTAAVPLLLVKLWAVYPKLFARPGTDARARALHLLERGSIAVLVASAIFQLVTGLANSSQWYPWGFGFRSTHFAVGWIAVGAMLVHVAVKLPLIRSAWGAEQASDRSSVQSGPDRDIPISRRSLLTATWLAVGAAVLTTSASGVPGLRRLSVLAVRSGNGPHGIPINKSAEAAGVTRVAADAAYQLTVRSATRTVRLSRGDLAKLPQVTATLPIACVEGWSAAGRWSGVRVRDLVALVGGDPSAAVLVQSMQRGGAYRASRLPGNYASDPLTLLALSLDGEPLSLDHGYPCRIIAPGRPGVLQTKWVSQLEVET